MIQADNSINKPRNGCIDIWNAFMAKGVTFGKHDIPFCPTTASAFPTHQVDEVIANGEKISPDKVLMITRDSDGRIIWMETGDSRSGFEHIIDRHGKEFNGRGISNDEIPQYILEAVCQGNIVGTQGKRNPRTIYEFTYNGVTQRIAVQVGNNGYIVSANCVSSKE